MGESQKNKEISSALISVYHKDGLEPIIKYLGQKGVTLYSTGGTFDFIKGLDVAVEKVEDLTGYPSILGGRVKTLHPKVFGGILSRREDANDRDQLETYEIPNIDLVIVDLYPFVQTVLGGGTQEEIIEKIDIGGISLIRAAAKNHNDVVIVSDKNDYPVLLSELQANDGATTANFRQQMALKAFEVTSAYDTAIRNYFAAGTLAAQSSATAQQAQVVHLRYGENPHQQARFEGNLQAHFNQLSGKELSYNNLVDADAAWSLATEFSDPCCIIVKHTNPCGAAVTTDAVSAWEKALQADSVSAFGGVIAFNTEVDIHVAERVNKIFFEIIMAPGYTQEALALLSKKENRIILQMHSAERPAQTVKSVFGGKLIQDADNKKETVADLKQVTAKAPTAEETEDLLFANIVAKHTKSNTIVLAKGKQLLGMGCGQTSRVDALKQAIAKAEAFHLDLQGAVMASDAFFPFPDCVQIAEQAGITAVIQPGGSIRDKDSIAYCDEKDMSMVLTGIRHFLH